MAFYSFLLGTLLLHRTRVEEKEKDESNAYKNDILRYTDKIKYDTISHIDSRVNESMNEEFF